MFDHTHNFLIELVNYVQFTVLAKLLKRFQLFLIITTSMSGHFILNNWFEFIKTLSG